MARRTNWRSVKIHRSYTVDEAARALNVCKATVRRWLKVGLLALREQKPILILGGDLADFLKQQKHAKQKCQPHECYCFKCRAPRKPALSEADYVPMNAVGGRLVALCTHCTTLMNKRISLKATEELNGILNISVRQADKRIADSGNPCLNDHLQHEEKPLA